MTNKIDESNNNLHYEDSLERDILIYEIFFNAYNSEWQRFRDIDNKASNIVGFVGVIFGLMLVVATSSLKNTITCLEFIWFFCSTIFFLLTFVFSLYALYLRELEVLPGLNGIMPHYVEKYIDREYILSRLTRKLANAIKHNHNKINDKTKYLEYSFLTFGTAITFIVFFIFDYFLI